MKKAPRPQATKTAKPRVLFFDYWTKGIEKFARIRDHDPDAAEFQLLHLGSLRDPQVPRTQILHGIRCVDYSAFAGLDIKQMLRSLQPDVVVELNSITYTDRALKLSCQQLGIPSVFLQHGNGPEPDQLEAWAIETTRAIRPKDYVKRLPKFVKLFPWYLKSTESLLSAVPWRVLAQLIRSPGHACNMPVEPQELWPERALVFAQKDADLFGRTHRMPADRLRIVGNPELDPLVRRRPLSAEQRQQLCQRLGLDAAKPIVVYCEESWVEAFNLDGWTDERRNASLRELHDVASSCGYQLLVRPHPVTQTASMEKALAGRSGLAITRQPPLADTLDLAAAAMGTMTTALETAIVLGRPIIVPTWHLSRPALSPYLTLGAAWGAADAKELRALLESLRDPGVAKPDCSRFVQQRLGAIDGLARQRIAHEVLTLAHEHLAGAGA